MLTPTTQEDLQLAFKHTDRAVIYIDSDEFLHRRENNRVQENNLLLRFRKLLGLPALIRKNYKSQGINLQPYECRVEQIENLIKQLECSNHYEIRCLNDLEQLENGFSVANDLGCKVELSIDFSGEHYEKLNIISETRTKQGLKNFPILVKLNAHDSEVQSLTFRRNQKRSATIGGTFDLLHKGHQDYIEVAFKYALEYKYADFLRILLTSDAGNGKKHKIEPYKTREKNLEKFIAHLGYENQYEIIPTQNGNRGVQEYIFSNEVQMVIVAPQYYSEFQWFNTLPSAKLLGSFWILVIQRTYHDGLDLSSTAIRDGRILYADAGIKSYSENVNLSDL